MGRRIYTILIAIGLMPGMRLEAQTWIQQTSNTTKDLWGVSFINNDTGYVCGYGGTILKTTNGGSTWLSQSSGTTYQLAGIYFIDANTGYAISYSDTGGILLKTTNGGNTWNNISLNLHDARSGGFWFFSADTGFFAVGDTNYSHCRILKTTNGGVSWDTVYSRGTAWISFMHFPDRNNGYLTGSGSTILKTTDGGANWDSLSVGGNLWMSGVYFFNKDTGFVGGGDFNTGGGAIFKTTDGGNDWQTSTTVYGVSVMLFTSLTTGYAIGGNSITTLKKMISTTDGGATWTQDTTKRQGLNDLCFPSPKVGYVVGDSGTILKYSGVTGVLNNATSLPRYISLSQNFPNPFNPITIINYQIPNDGHVTLKVYDVLGREIKTLVNQYQQVGRYNVSFDASNLASGIYFYRVNITDNNGKNFVATKKMLLMK